MGLSSIDLNADVGEGGADDAALLALVSSANIACGWHAGDGAAMRAALQACRAHGVAPGAHPSFPDRANFGRRAMVRAPQDVEADLIAQIAGLQALAAREGLRLSHVKPHGALYNQAADDAALADAIARAVCAVDPDLALMGLAGGELLRAAARHGLRAIAEGFADRGYRADGRLLRRDQPGALLHDPAEALRQALALARGEPLPNGLVLRVDSLCLHGDGAQALLLARALRQGLEQAGMPLRALSS